jgi:hypothetical protein
MSSNPIPVSVPERRPEASSTPERKPQDSKNPKFVIKVVGQIPF